MSGVPETFRGKVSAANGRSPGQARPKTGPRAGIISTRRVRALHAQQRSDSNMISNAIAVRAEHAPYGLLGLAVSKDVRGSHKALERMDWIAAMRPVNGFVSRRVRKMCAHSLQNSIFLIGSFEVDTGHH